MSELKEPRFFSREDYEEKWNWYEALFKNVTTEKAIGEASVNYSETHIWPEVPKRIKKHIPEAKLIYIVRNPLRRMESCWKQALSTGHWHKHFYVDNVMPLNFERAVREYPHFVGTSKYWYHLKAFKEYFSDDKILLIFFEDFTSNPGVELKKCFRFLEVDTDVNIKGKNISRNAAKGKTMDRPLLTKIKQMKVVKSVKQFIPEKLRAMVAGALLRKSVPATIKWNFTTKKWVLNQLSKDIDSILNYAGKPSDFWNLN